jgi:hypothetical protein
LRFNLFDMDFDLLYALSKCARENTSTEQSAKPATHVDVAVFVKAAKDT